MIPGSQLSYRNVGTDSALTRGLALSVQGPAWWKRTAGGGDGGGGGDGDGDGGGDGGGGSRG